MSQKPTYEELEQMVRELEHAESAQKQPEEKLKYILDSLPDMIFEVDKNAKILWANKTALDSSFEALGQTCYSTFPGDEEICKGCNCMTVFKTGKIEKCIVYHATSKTIGERYWENTGVPLKDENGVVSTVLEISRNVTDQKQAEEKLRKNETKMKSIFRAAPVGIGVVINRVFQEVNKRFCEITGYSREELIGQSSRMIYPSDEDYEYVGIKKYKGIKKQGTGSVDTRFKRKDGKVIDAILSSTPIDPSDLSAGVTFTALEITERKQAEEELQKSAKTHRTVLQTTMDGFWLLNHHGN